MKKRGQFFLIAALLISGITIGFGTLYNTAAIERADTRVYDLSEQLHAELQQVYDSGTLNPVAGTPEEQRQALQDNLQRLAAVYQEQNPDSNIVVFYGDGENVKKLSGETDQLKTYDCSETGCNEEAEDVPTSLTEYRFGGIFGTHIYYDATGNEVSSAKKYILNPLAASRQACPSSQYKPIQFFGKAKGLADLYVCLGPVLTTTQVYDFGGLYVKKGSEIVQPNPLTNAACASGYKDEEVPLIRRGGFNDQYTLHWCYRLHVATSTGENLLYSAASASTVNDPTSTRANFPAALSCPTTEGYQNSAPRELTLVTSDTSKSISSALTFCYKKGRASTALGASTVSESAPLAAAGTSQTTSAKKYKKVHMNLKFNDKGIASANTAQDAQKQSPAEEVSKEFEMKPEQKFYIVVLKKVKNERVVVSR